MGKTDDREGQRTRNDRRRVDKGMGQVGDRETEVTERRGRNIGVQRREWRACWGAGRVTQ